jgi:aminopeptidase N
MRLRWPLLALIILTAPLPASAQRLPGTVTPDHYDLAFVVDLARERFEGTETIRVRLAEPTSKIVLHAFEIEFREVTIGTGAAAQTATVALDEESQTATLSVAKPINKGPTEIRIRYNGILNSQLRGFYISKTPLRKYAVTQFEATDARRAFPSFDEPAFKATFAVTLTIDRGDTAISNGKALSDMPGPLPTQHTIKFATTPKMSSYLVAMTVGDFKCLDGAAEGVPIRICATPDKRDLGRIALESAERIITFYNGYYRVKYPFGKLDVVAVPDFAAGAMENTAAIFYRETDLLADSRSASVDTRKKIWSILAHEMAHQWFGDLVTMQWWDDIWLNEGFATWMQNKPLAAAHPEWNITVDEAVDNQTALSLDSLKSTRSVHTDVQTPAQIDEAFDAIAYQKGAAVLRMLEGYVGAETFRKGVNAYIDAHAYKNATSEDFSKSLAGASGKPVERILPSFVNQPGVPLVNVSIACDNGKTAVTLKQQRFVIDPAEHAPGRWQIPVCLKTPSQATPTCELLSEESRTISVGDGCAPWVFANAGADGYYRTAYSSEMLRAMAPRLSADLAPDERLSLLDDEWAMARTARHNVGDYLTLVASLGREHVGGVIDEAASRLDFIREYLTTAATRPKVEAFTRSLFRPLFDELGFSGVGVEADDRRALRAAVVAALGTIAEDPEVVSMSRTAVDRSLSIRVDLEPTMAGAMIKTAAMHGDAALFDALAAAADRVTDPNEHYRYLFALAEFRDPALVDRGLSRALSSQLRTQDTAIYLSRFFANPDARDRAFAFLIDNWPALEPKLTIFGGDTYIVRSMAAFCDAQSRDKVKQFFTEHKLPAAVRALDQTLETINNCIALREKQAPNVEAWLAAR